MTYELLDKKKYYLWSEFRACFSIRPIVSLPKILAGKDTGKGTLGVVDLSQGSFFSEDEVRGNFGRPERRKIAKQAHVFITK